MCSMMCLSPRLLQSNDLLSLLAGVLHRPNKWYMDFENCNFDRLLCAGVFNAYIYWSRGAEAAFDWGKPLRLQFSGAIDDSDCVLEAPVTCLLMPQRRDANTK